MKGFIRLYFVPIMLAIVTAVTVLIFSNIYHNEFLAYIPFNGLLFITTLYMIYTIFQLPSDLQEKKFWKVILIGFILYSVGVILRNYVWPFFIVPSMISDLTHIFYIAAMSTMLSGIFHLIRTFRIKLTRKRKLELFVTGISTLTILLLIFIPRSIGSHINWIALASYLILSIFCAVAIILAITLYLSTKTGKLREPFLFMSLSIFMLIIQLGSTASGYSLGNLNSMLHPAVLIPYVLFLMFAMMSMCSRIRIAKNMNDFVQTLK